MADSKITALTSIGTITDPAVDPLVIVDVSDTSMAATGTTKKVTLNNLLACSPTATLASATITGAANFNGGALAGYLNGNLMFGSSGNTVNFFAQTSGFAFKENTGANNLLTISNAGVFGFLDGAGGTRMTLNSTGLGVGVASPAYKVHSVVTSGFAGRFNSSTAVAGGILAGNSVADLIVGVDASGNGRLTADTSKYLGLGSGGINDRFILDTSGNVGVGVTPSAWGGSFKAIQTTGGAVGSNSATQYYVIQNAYLNTSGAWTYTANGLATMLRQNAGAYEFFNAVSGTAGNSVTWTQAMTLDASGNLLVGTTSNAPAGTQSQFVNQWSGGAKWGSTFNQTVSSATAYTHIAFCTNGAVRGSIDANNTTITYGTVSDYRLKENVQPISNALTRIAALKPSTYKWKDSGTDGEGFIAHELAAVVPLAVVGQKDAVNEDGSIKAQQIDLSKVVPILVAAIQELTARVEALEA